MNVLVAEVEAGKTLEFAVESGRQAYLLCVEGAARFESVARGTEHRLAVPFCQ